MLLIIYGLLALVPLLGIAWILLHGSLPPHLPTVDDLFMSLIFLAISGIFGMTALFEFRTRLRGTGNMARKAPVRVATRGNSGANFEYGRVESVQFFESSVGQPNKSIVTLSDGADSSRWLVFEGDMRNALPVGKKVEITSREDAGRRILLNVEYD